tara:strand:- start:6605 stop:7144 length:540 start_codon:yes stop_codon:yes gene_type:complete
MRDDYELLPQRDIVKLKRELDELKRNELSSKVSDEDIKQLNNNLRELIEIIRVSSNEMKFEETDLYSQKLSLVNKKLDKLMYENKEIAEGIVVVADLIKKAAPSHHAMHHPAAPRQQPIGAPGQPEPMPPKLSQPPIPPPLGLPQGIPTPGGRPVALMPMPHVEKPQKKGLFGGMFKKK